MQGQIILFAKNLAEVIGEEEVGRDQCIQSIHI